MERVHRSPNDGQASSSSGTTCSFAITRRIFAAHGPSSNPRYGRGDPQAGQIRSRVKTGTEHEVTFNPHDLGRAGYVRGIGHRKVERDVRADVHRRVSTGSKELDQPRRPPAKRKARTPRRGERGSPATSSPSLVSVAIFL
jgi:hypothetical protein